MFFAKFATVIVLILIGLRGITSLYSRSHPVTEGHLEVKKLNEKYQNMSLALKFAVLPKKAFKQALKQQRTEHKQAQKAPADSVRQKVYVLNFDGDVRASEVASLRETITAVLAVATDSDEVVLLLESSGGTVHGYGLAASQLKRIVNHGIKLTVVVDKVAASGGYMMACVADQIVAAPFAVVGSIGVIGQLPNFNRLLKNHDIDFEQIIAGEHKRTLSVFGENTDTGRRKYQNEIDETHKLFKDFVIKNRPKLDIEAISTGEHWYGTRALELNLVDQLYTSDDYLCDAAKHADVFVVDYVRRKPLMERLFSSTTALLKPY